MAVRESAAYHQFLAYDAFSLCAGDFQFTDSSGGAAGQWRQAQYAAEIFAKTVGHEAGDFFLRQCLCPAVEVGSLAVIAVEHLREHSPVGGVAEGFRLAEYPADGVFFHCKVGEVSRVYAVAPGLEIGARSVIPACLEDFEDSAAAFREAGVAELAVEGEDHAAGVGHGSGGHRGRDTADALIALAVVVGADVEIEMVFAVPVSDERGAGIQGSDIGTAVGRRDGLLAA